MIIKRAEYYGFCSGVNNAVKKTLEIANQRKSVFVLGPLVHNELVNEYLKSRGVTSIEKIEELKSKTGPVIIRAHGLPPDERWKLEEYNLEIIDCTCPYVKKAQETARKFAEEGYHTIVIGEKNHPEVKGILGYTGYKGEAILSREAAEKVQFYPKIGIIIQTTQNIQKVQEILPVFIGKCKELRVYNTICSATKKRQDAALTLAKQVDLIIVVGSKSSANTNHLLKICEDAGTEAHLVENVDDLKNEWFKNKLSLGVTAGASTPDWLIEEVIKRMVSENEKRIESAEQTGDHDSMEMYYKNIKGIHAGEIVKGVIVQIDNDVVLVDIGYKSDGKISTSEFSDLDNVKVGDEVEAMVIRVEDREGYVLLSKSKVDVRKTWEKLVNAYEEKIPVVGKVIEKVKGGLLVDVGIKAFLPASLVDRNYVKDINPYVGKDIRAEIIELDREKNKVVLSAKAIAEKDYQEKINKLWDELSEGQIRKGVVKRITDFGAFIDIGGVEGLLHISELSWGRVKHTSEVLKEGQEIEVYVLSVDREKGRISLGLKQLTAHPWDNIEDKYKAGDIVEGKVVSIVPFGAFVELEEGVEGLVHISQLSRKHVAKTEEVVEIGEQIPVKILDINREDRRISLSLKDAVGVEIEENVEDKPLEDVSENQIEQVEKNEEEE